MKMMKSRLRDAAVVYMSAAALLLLSSIDPAAGPLTGPEGHADGPADPAVHRNGSEQLILGLSSPDEEGVLIVQHHKGTVRITGYDGEMVIVNASPRYVDTAVVASGGMKPFPGHSIKLHAIEKHNVVTVSTNSHERTIDLEVRVPFDFSLHLEKHAAGDVHVHYLRGEMEITSSAGNVSLTGISGSAVISTVEGDILLRFERVTPHAPMAFTSVTGDIDVAFPADVRASVKMMTGRGDIRSDFDIEVDRRQAKTQTSESTGIQRAFLEDWTYGSLGGGGPRFLFRSYRGNITIRKSGNHPRGAE